MKRYLLILLAFLPLLSFSQISNGRVIFGSGNVVFQGGSVIAPLWSKTVTDNYLALNPHYTSYFSEEVSEYFSVVLDRNYEMPDGSDNYYDVFGHNGLNNNSGDWLLYVRFYDTLFQSVLTIPKTGDVMKWQLDDSVYIQNNIPNHQIGQNPGKGLLTSTDGFSGVNGTVYLGATSFTGEMPQYGFTFNRLFFLTNSFFGAVPNFTNSSAARITGSFNFFTDIEGVSNLLNPLFEQYIFSSNKFSQVAVDRLMQELHDYYSVNTPTRNVIINVSDGSSSPPSAAGATNITNLETIFTNAGFTITITTN